MMGFASGFLIKAHPVQVSCDISGLSILLPALCTGTELQRRHGEIFYSGSKFFLFSD
jgi:hypothetical protein